MHASPERKFKLFMAAIKQGYMRAARREAWRDILMVARIRHPLANLGTVSND
jgi:hypothetical protein